MQCIRARPSGAGPAAHTARLSAAAAPAAEHRSLRARVPLAPPRATAPDDPGVRSLLDRDRAMAGLSAEDVVAADAFLDEVVREEKDATDATPAPSPAASAGAAAASPPPPTTASTPATSAAKSARAAAARARGGGGKRGGGKQEERTDDDGCVLVFFFR
jgi:hypothetical protein